MLMLALQVLIGYLCVGVGFWLSFVCFVVPIRKAYHHTPSVSDHLVVLFLWFFVVCVGLTDEGALGPHD